MRFLVWALLALAPSAQAALIVHTNDILGEIEPCGCRSNPLGGMARMANFLKKHSDQPILQLDAGDLLFSSDSLPEILKNQSEVQAGFLIEALNMTHLDASVPGEKDFALGYKTFQKLRKKAKFEFLAANLKLKSGGALFKADQIFTKKEKGKTIRIGVFGLVGDDLSWPKELKASSALVSAKAEVGKLKKNVDFLVALTHESYEKDQELAAKVPGIDFIIGGHSQTFLQQPFQAGHTTIFESSFRNQYVGLIPLKKPWNPESYQLVGLDPGFDSPPEAPSAMDDLVKRFKLAIAELNSKQEATIEKTTGQPASGPKFQTFPRCAECHLKQFDFWRKTAHETALAPLVKAKQVMNKECLLCHTVGLGDPKGFKTVTHLAEIKRQRKKNPRKSRPSPFRLMI